ncbi:unnamed protein product [Phytophthora fragariaefolia]|uniref:Unnamed protein product n=1 Tax=Phytophthora fragariaefolia TaxID=1490495 RepID=A0A9W7CPN6_9STRA|nr:unnamed protein product [Phytophthora fragariaefolia]
MGSTLRGLPTCEACCIKAGPAAPAPHRHKRVGSISMDFIFGLPRNAQGRTGILVTVDRFSKMVHPAPVATEVTADESAELFLHLCSDTTVYWRPSCRIAILASDPRSGRGCSCCWVPDYSCPWRLLSTDGIQGSSVTNLGANKLAPRFIGPFKILKVIGDAYTLDIPTSMRLHPTFYVGRLKPYVPATIPAPEAERLQPARNPRGPSVDADAESALALAPHARVSPSVARRIRATPSDEAAPPSRVAPAPTE